MTELSERLPLVFRIQAILRASSSDDPISKETIEFLTEPSFLSLLQTNEWFSLAVNLHNIYHQPVFQRRADVIPGSKTHLCFLGTSLYVGTASLVHFGFVRFLFPSALGGVLLA